MVDTRPVDELALDIPEPSTGRGQDPRAPPHGNAPPPPPPVSIELMLATQNNLMTTQNDLMRRLVENDERRGVGRRQQPR
jgi:hypothetical protein